jgi:hypothetical protein
MVVTRRVDARTSRRDLRTSQRGSPRGGMRNSCTDLRSLVVTGWKAQVSAGPSSRPLSVRWQLQLPCLLTRIRTYVRPRLVAALHIVGRHRPRAERSYDLRGHRRRRAPGARGCTLMRPRGPGSSTRRRQLHPGATDRGGLAGRSAPGAGPCLRRLGLLGEGARRSTQPCGPGSAPTRRDADAPGRRLEAVATTATRYEQVGGSSRARRVGCIFVDGADHGGYAGER